MEPDESCKRPRLELELPSMVSTFPTETLQTAWLDKDTSESIDSNMFQMSLTIAVGCCFPPLLR